LNKGCLISLKQQYILKSILNLILETQPSAGLGRSGVCCYGEKGANLLARTVSPMYKTKTERFLGSHLNRQCDIINIRQVTRVLTFIRGTQYSPADVGTRGRAGTELGPRRSTCGEMFSHQGTEGEQVTHALTEPQASPSRALHYLHFAFYL
jgi:hypothetical protein